MIQYQILQIDIVRIVWQKVWRITNEILGVKELGSRWDYSVHTQNINSKRSWALKSDLLMSSFLNLAGRV